MNISKEQQTQELAKLLTEYDNKINLNDNRKCLHLDYLR